MRIASRLAAAVLATAALLSTTDAEAGFVGPVSVSGPTASSGLPAVLGEGDVGVMVGNVMGAETSFHHRFSFTTDDAATATAGARSNELSMVLGIDDLVVSFDGATWAPLVSKTTTAHVANTLHVKGTTSGALGGNYIADLAITETPVPGAALLFGSALAGMAYLRRRRAA